MRYTDIVMLLVAAVARPFLFRKAHIPARSLAWLVRLGHALWRGGDGFRSALLRRSAQDRLRCWGDHLCPQGDPAEPETHAVLPGKSDAGVGVGLGALIWMATRVVRGLSLGARRRSRPDSRRDAVIGLVLAVGWFGLWALYLAYTWTAQAGTSAGGATAIGGGGSYPSIRFYLPAIGLIALLGAWLLMQLPKWLPALPGHRRDSRVLLFPEPDGG